jgi:hypothetical protein
MKGIKYEGWQSGDTLLCALPGQVTIDTFEATYLHVQARGHSCEPVGATSCSVRALLASSVEVSISEHVVLRFGGLTEGTWRFTQARDETGGFVVTGLRETRGNEGLL